MSRNRYYKPTLAELAALSSIAAQYLRDSESPDFPAWCRDYFRQMAQQYLAASLSTFGAGVTRMRLDAGIATER